MSLSIFYQGTEYHLTEDALSSKWLDQCQSNLVPSLLILYSKESVLPLGKIFMLFVDLIVVNSVSEIMSMLR